MVGWHHRLNGHKFEQTPGNGEGQGSLAGCSPWDRKVRHDRATEQQQIHYRAFAKFAGYLPPHRGCPDKQGLASGKAPSSLQGSDPLQCPQAGPPSHPASLWGDLEWQRVSAFQDNEAKPTQWALVVVLIEGPFSLGPGPRQWNILRVSCSVD